MQERRDEIDALGAGLLGVSVAAAHQATWLQEEKGISYPLLLDPESNLKGALGFQRMALWKYLLPTTWWNYVKGWRHARQGAVTGRPDDLPGIVIVDTDGTLRYRYEGKTLGDYPKIDDVIAALRER